MDDKSDQTTDDVNTEEGSTTSELSKGSELSFDAIKDSKGVSLENRWSEMARKLNKVSDLESKLDQILNTVNTSQTSQQTAGEYEDYGEFEGMSAKEIAKIIDSRLADREAASLQQQHFQDFEQLKQQYPELDKNSADYDPEFYNLANNAYLNFGLNSKKEGARDAVEYAAYKSGKAKANLQKEVLTDEARRSRRLAEGSSGSKKAKGESDDSEALQKASKHFRINPKYYKKAKAQLGQRS